MKCLCLQMVQYSGILYSINYQYLFESQTAAMYPGNGPQITNISRRVTQRT